jgi:hypothetical protein
MSASSMIADTWHAILEGTPGARRSDPLIIQAAHQHPVIRQLFPFPTHGTPAFFRVPPTSLPVDPADEMPFIVYGAPYQIFTPGYGTLVGEATTPEKAVALLAANLPTLP